MQHTLRISVSRKPQSGGVVAIRNVSVRERLLRFLLGEKRKLTILVPGDTNTGGRPGQLGKRHQGLRAAGGAGRDAVPRLEGGRRPGKPQVCQ